MVLKPSLSMQLHATVLTRFTTLHVQPGGCIPTTPPSVPATSQSQRRFRVGQQAREVKWSGLPEPSCEVQCRAVVPENSIRADSRQPDGRVYVCQRKPLQTAKIKTVRAAGRGDAQRPAGSRLYHDPYALLFAHCAAPIGSSCGLGAFSNAG